MPDERSPEEKTEQEIEKQAERTPYDPETRREGLEVELMEEGRSKEGEEIGEEME